MNRELWAAFNHWHWLYYYAKKKRILSMIKIARRMEGWNPDQFVCYPETDPPRLLVSFDGQEKVTLSKERLHEMFKHPIKMLRWVRKHSYGKGLYG